MNTADVPLSDRVDEHFRAVGLPLLDTNGMMRHILDCLGALKVRLSEELESKAMVTVFGNAVRAIVNHITEEDLIDSQSAMGLLLETFPDDMKRRDGRSWLPLHWAAALHETDPEHMNEIIQARPVNAMKGHLHCSNVGEHQADDHAYRGLMPLHFAVSAQHPNILNIRALIEANHHALASPDHRGWLPLHWCAYNSRDAQVVRLIIKSNEDAVYQVNKRGKLPFQMAAYNRFTEVMDILHKRNPEAVEGMDYNGNTPLHDAVKCFNPEGEPPAICEGYQGRLS